MRIEFPELGHNQWIEIRDPKWMTWGEKKKFLEQGKDETIESQLNMADHIVLALVKNGHITNEHGQPIPFPLTKESLDQLPAIVVERISEEFAKSNREAVPKN
jgi:hypothetical protein